MPKKAAPANETAPQRFIRLANGRYSVAAAAIDNIGKLTGPLYESTSDQHKKLFGSLRAKIDEAERSLAANKPGARAKETVL